MTKETKKKNILTLILIIIVAVIIGIIGYLGFELITGQVSENNASEITDEFDRQVPTITAEEALAAEAANGEETQGTSGTSGSTGGGSGRSYYGSGSSSSGGKAVNVNGYWVVGQIRIPATNIKYSIFSTPTAQALEKGIGLLYSSNGLNQPGNTVLNGHNYRNRQFFSRNKNLNVGDKIIIKDASGVEVTYSIYNKFITNDQDASFYQRDTGGAREITLSTCTDQGTKTGERLIIFARE